MKKFSKSPNVLRRRFKEREEGSSRESSPSRYDEDADGNTKSSKRFIGSGDKQHGFLWNLKAKLSKRQDRDKQGAQSQQGNYSDGTDYSGDNSSAGSSVTTSPKKQAGHRSSGDNDIRKHRSTENLSFASHTNDPKKKGKSWAGWKKQSQSFGPFNDEQFMNDNQDAPKPLSGHSSIIFSSLQNLVSPVINNPPETIIKLQREAILRQYPFFQLHVHLREARDLIPMDTSGYSDPYVKFKCGNRLLYKSKTINKNLNPVWDEKFTLSIDDALEPITIKVFDYDWGLQDDYLGGAILDMTLIDLNTKTELNLPLSDPSKDKDYMGVLSLAVTLNPKSQEEKEQMMRMNAEDEEGSYEFYQKIPKTAQDVNKKLKAQIWNSVVTIVLVEGKNLLPMDPDGCSDPYAKFRSVAGCCKFKLGNEKYKSKIAFRTLCPQWLEQFDLHIYDDQSQILEITVWDYDSRTKDDYIGKCSIDLSTLEKEKTHGIEKELEDGGGTLYLLLTISGTTASETISDLTTYQENPMEKKNIIKRYSLVRSFQNMKDVGYLQVKVFKAQGLAAADINGKSDPFCVLELVNARLQTQTEYKTLTPQWNKIFTFQVKDIHTYLEITVYDEDKDGKVDFLGKVSIPLLKIRNGEKRWYALKDKKMRMRAKGNNPQILLELSVYYNPVRAAVRTMNPKETKYMQPDRKFKRQIFLRNVARLKALTPALVEMGKLVRSFFEWESPIKSIIAYVGFLLITLYFELWMVPIGVLLLFVKNYIVLSVTGWMYYRDDFDEFYDDDDDEEEKEKTRVQEEEKKSLKERFQAIQDVTQMVQNIVGDIASFTESGINTFNFTVPFLSYMAITLLVVATIALYYLPLRLIIIAAGTNKFFKKLFRPHAIPNNEVLDFLSRVPDNEILVECRELRIQPLTEADKKMKDQRKRKPTASFNS